MTDGKWKEALRVSESGSVHKNPQLFSKNGPENNRMSVVVEEYKPAHHKAVIEIITTIQQQEFGLPITYENQPDLADISGFYDAFLVALSEKEPVGTIGFKAIHDFAIIRKMFVVQAFRGPVLGIAQKLLTALEGKIISRGFRKIYLGTTEFFKAAHKFYERNGYTEIPQKDLPTDFPVMTVDTKFYYKMING